MEQTLVIYDNNGKIFTQITGDYIVPVGLQYIEIVVPEKKMVASVNPITHEPIFEDIPPSEIDLLKQRTEDLEILLTDIIMGGF